MPILSDFKIYDANDVAGIFELSDRREEKIYVDKKSGMKHGCIKNLYKDPVKVTEFFRQFPIVTEAISNAPGLQLYFSTDTSKALLHVYQYLEDVLRRNKYPLGTRAITSQSWETYCNFHWKNMHTSVKSILPHFDFFNYAFNIWLTEENTAGTEFFSYQFEDFDPVYYVGQFHKEHPKRFTSFFETLNVEFRDREVWDPNDKDFFKNNGFERYLVQEPEYNSATFYPGIFFHKPVWEPGSYDPDWLRFSQVIACAVEDGGKFQEQWYDYSNTPDFNFTVDQ